ncbi:MAG: hypothetical protein A2Y10_06030 [Planctomycetes bacterium GWF2_41_51]|nr:MAG: hypothetical protein A2Y10_06030 [Planctomycetes bacterium GWF2_41_51]
MICLMEFKEQYEKAKKHLLADELICKANRDLLKEFFVFEEWKLKRQNGLATLDNSCYKTLSGYVYKLKKVNDWFKNKPWKDLTKEDIQKVYDDLEDGIIKNQRGQKYGDTAGYYSKIFRGKPFKLAGKSEIAENVLEYHTSMSNKEVRFVTEEEFRKLVSVVSNPAHLALLWLQWDIGENINTLLALTKNNIIKQKNPHTNENEYIVNLPKAKIKRSRITRSEPTLYPETVRYLDMVLNGLKDNDKIFTFEHRQALKVIQNACRKSGAKCMPIGDAIRWKDLRSGMACHLLKSGWTRDEVNARLGHTPSSKSLNAYINYLAIDRHAPKKRLLTSNLQEVQNELEEARRREKLQAERIERQQEELRALQMKVDEVLRLKGIA